VAGDPGLRRGRHPRADRARGAVTEAIALPPNQDTTGEEWTVLAERPDGRRGDCLRGRPAGPACPGWPSRGGERLAGAAVRGAGRDVSVAGTVRPRPGTGLDLLLDEAMGYRADGTSRITLDPAARPGAAYDGDPATAWLPAPATRPRG
jgi:hypothetical protein